MSSAVIDDPRSEQAQAWWFLDTLVVEHRRAPGMDTIALEMTLPVGSAPPLHVHHDLDDTWYILEGEMVVRCGDDEALVGAGHWVSMPRGVPHAFRVVGDREARILLVHDNASFLDLVRDLGVPADERIVPTDAVVPCDGRAGADRRIPRPHARRPAVERRRQRRHPRRTSLTPFRVQVLGHVVLKVRNPHQSEDFYGGLLGMPVGFRTRPSP